LQDNPRSKAILAIAKENGLNLELVEISEKQSKSPEYLKIHPLGKIPAFVSAKGYTLTECIAIAVYGEQRFLHRSSFSEYTSWLLCTAYRSDETLS